MSKPNFIVIMVDQQQASMTKREGFPLDLTPYQDKMAEHGIWFNKAYTSCPLCAPARVSLFTGRYASAHHVMQNPGPPRTVSPRDIIYEKDLVSILKENGYTTALIGKNHSHLQKHDFDHCQNNQRFPENNQKAQEIKKRSEEWLNKCERMPDEPNPYGMESQSVYYTVNESIKWLDRQNNNSFFLWLSIVEPHPPYHVPDPYFSMFDNDKNTPPFTEKSNIAGRTQRLDVLNDLFEYSLTKKASDKNTYLKRIRRNYLGMIRMVDDQVKKFVEHLKTTGLYENTYIIFLSDHGEMAGEFGVATKGFGLFDLLCRIPMIITGPGIKKQNQPSAAHVSITDIMPTILDILDIEIPDSVQGKSLWPLLQGKKIQPEEFASAYCEYGVGGEYFSKDYLADKQQEVFRQNISTTGAYFDLCPMAISGVMRMVRKGDWKMIYDMNKNGELYNLKNDPWEEKNLFQDKNYTQVKMDLLEELLQWVLRVQDPMVMREDHNMNPVNRLIDKHNHWYGTDYKYKEPQPLIYRREFLEKMQKNKKK